MRTPPKHAAEPIEVFTVRRASRKANRRLGKAPQCERLEARSLRTGIVEHSLPTPGADPRLIAGGPDGNMWFTEYASNAIGRITPSGAVTEFAIPTPNSQPVGITAGPDGDLWFTESGAGKIGRITPSGTITEFSIGNANADPQVIVSGPNGDLWFTEANADAIGRISTSGTVTQYSIPTANSHPLGLTVDSSGTLWFTENGANQIGSFQPSGSSGIFAGYPVPTSNSDLRGITAGPDGNLWFAEYANSANQVDRMTPTGTFTAFPVSPAGANPRGIATGGDGNLWFTENDAGANRIGRITPGGQVTYYSTPTSGSQPLWISAGPNETIWFTEEGANQIGMLQLDAPLAATGTSIVTHEGIPFTGTVATFTDGDPNGAASQFTATIRWGDGTTTAGTVTADPNGGFDVGGTHTYDEYAESAPGTISVSIADVDGATAVATSTVDNNDDYYVATSRTINASENSPFTGSVAQMVATFVDADPTPNFTGYAITINWGDGTTTAGTLVPVGNGGLFLPPNPPSPLNLAFTLNGTHTYAAPGTYTVTASFLDADGSAASAVSTAVVADAPLTATGRAVSATEGEPFLSTVARFSDADPDAGVTNYTATIDWGDGTTTAGTIATDPAGGFDVAGGHTYAGAGSADVSVTITDNVGANTTATAVATIADAPLSASGLSFVTTEGAPFSGAVAHFTDADPNGKASFYSATIDWGDGTTTAGTVLANVAGGFDVDGTHTYAEEGAPHVVVQIADAGGSQASVSTTGSVADAALGAIGTTVQATEGQAFSAVVAHFTDANLNGTIGDYTATIVWGDGSTTAGTVMADAGGGFDVSGTHTYGEAGSYAVAVSIADAGGSTASTVATATVADAALTATGVAVTATGGQVFTGVVGHFVDADPNGVVGDYTATIDWGDGSTTAGTVALDGSGGFQVNGSHVYAEEGQYTLSVSVADVGGASTSIGSSVEVADAPLTATATPVSATEGQGFTGVVAHFTDGDPNGVVSDYAATIAWGDGATTVGTVTATPSGGFDVTGTHTYAEEGSYPVTVELVDTGGAAATASGAANVSDAPLSSTGLTLNTTEGQAFTAILAHFTDANPGGSASDFRAAVDWGDGTTTAGTVIADGQGGYFVSGDHTYSEEGTCSVSVSINDAGGSTTACGSVVEVADALLSSTGVTLGATEGQVFTAAVAHFDDADPNGTATDYTATIDWGNGTTTVGTVVADPNGGFAVTGAHTYAEEGQYPVVVNITDTGGASTRAASVAQVADAPLSATSSSLVTTEGQGFSAVVAHFTDADPNGTATDYSAQINWGDGATTAGTVTASVGGGFDVTGSHTYAEEGYYAVAVSVADAGGATVSTSSSAAVADAPLTARGTTNASTAGQVFSGVVGHFTDADPNGAVSDYTATIVWGDGATTAGSVVAGTSGGFDVTGSHTYGEEGNYAVAVSIADAAGATASTVTTATVADAPLSATGVAVSATEGQAFTAAVAQFTDADPNGAVGDYSATIDWGDGTKTSGTVTADAAGGFEVSGHHAYTEEGQFAISVSIADAGGASTNADAVATVADAPLTASSLPFTAIEGEPLSAVVAGFIDADPNGRASDYAATIVWGDGRSSQGTISPDGQGGFLVSGSTTYEAAGVYPLSVEIADEGGSTVTVTRSTPVWDAPLSAAGITISAVEGQPFSAVVAHFADADANGVASFYTATIDWGDGLTTAGTVAPDGQGGFGVYGDHTYAEEGSYPLSVTIADEGGATVTVGASAQVSDAPLVASGATVDGTEGLALNAIVAHFTDADPNGAVGDYTATINWGDGTTTAGTVAPDSAGGFRVAGSHTYAEDGTFAVSVEIADAGGAAAVASAAARVADAPLDVAGLSVSATEGQSFSAVVAHFTDTDPDGAPSDYTATIDWGDGTSSTGTVVANPLGGFDVDSSHTFAGQGTYPVAVHVDDRGGSTASAVTGALVSDAPLTSAGVPVSAMEGQPFSGTVAQFADGNPQAGASDHTASIVWGDGTTSIGTIAPAKGGGFIVTGSHVFTHAGSSQVYVQIGDNGGAGTSAVSTADVAAASLDASGRTMSLVLGETFTGVVASFQGVRPDGTMHDYSAEVEWGDGQSSPAHVVQNDRGGFDVISTHAYGIPTQYAVQVAIYDTSGASAVVQGSMIVTTGGLGGPLDVPGRSSVPELVALPPNSVTTTGVALGGPAGAGVSLDGASPSPGVLQGFRVVIGGATGGPSEPEADDGAAPALGARAGGPVSGATPSMVRVRATLVAAANALLNNLARLDWSGFSVGAPSSAAAPAAAVLAASTSTEFRKEMLWSELNAMDRELAQGEVPTTVFLAISSGLVVTAGYVCWTARGGYLLASLLAASPLWRQLDPLSILDLHDKRQKWRRGPRRDEVDDEERLQTILKPHSAPLPVRRGARQDVRR